VPTFTSFGNWRAQVRRKGRYAADTFRRRKDAEEWALDICRRAVQAAADNVLGQYDLSVSRKTNR
jgi:hypothetical protein